VFLHTSGFIPQLTGGYTPQLSLNNSGFYYDAYYVTDDQKQAASWMCKTLGAGPTPKAYDAYAKLRIDSDCAAKMVVTSPLDNYKHAYMYNYGPNVREETYMVNINSNLYYYKVDRRSFLSERLYDNGSTHVSHVDGREQK
jgi:hypothetical protein